MKETINELLDLLEQYKEVANNCKSVDKFSQEFFDSKDPLTEIMIKIGNREYIRLENMDFAGKDYMFIN